MTVACAQENCTVAETATCLLNNNPNTCPHRLALVPSIAADVSALTSPLPSPVQHPRFPRSLTLTPVQTHAMMAERYCTLIGILGDPDSGKTAALVSMYLLASNAQLEGFRFADCRSIMAFNEISQRARHWNEGAPPDQMTSHTEAPDERTAGFLHLRLFREDRGEKIDFLFPDLPGEWSQDMVDKQRVDRLEFLKAADVIWLMMDGTQLLLPSKRQHAVHRMQLLIQRLAAVMNDRRPLILVLTRFDKGEVPQKLIQPLLDEAKLRGFDMTTTSIASFSDVGGVRPGSGIAKLLIDSCPPAGDAKPFWPESDDDGAETRCMMRFRIPETMQ